MIIPKPGKLQSCEGFTLTEILVVVAMIITLTGFGYSGFSGWQKKERVRSVAYDFAAQLREARMRAMEKRVDQTFIFSGNQYTILNDANGDCEANGGEIVVRQVTVDQEDKGITMTTSRTPLEVRFDTKGIPWGKNGLYGNCSVHFTNDTGYALDIKVSSLGRIKIEESN